MHAYTSIQPCMHTSNIHTSIHTNNQNTYKQTYERTHAHTHIYTHTHIHTYTHTHIQSHTHTDTRTYRHTHTHHMHLHVSIHMWNKRQPVFTWSVIIFCYSVSVRLWDSRPMNVCGARWFFKSYFAGRPSTLLIKHSYEGYTDDLKRVEHTAMTRNV